MTRLSITTPQKTCATPVSSHLPTKEEATEMARRLTGALKENHRLSVKHGQALGLIGRIFGCASSNALLKRIETCPSTSAGERDAITQKAFDVLDLIDHELSQFKPEALPGLGLNVILENTRAALAAAGMPHSEPRSPSIEAGNSLPLSTKPLQVDDRVIDLVGDQGFGRIIDLYTNRMDNPNGETLAVVRFGRTSDFGEDTTGHDDEPLCDEEEIITDRSLHEIKRVTHWAVNVRAIISGHVHYLRKIKIPECWDIYDFSADDEDDSAILRCDTLVTVWASSFEDAVKAAIHEAPSLGVRYDQATVKLWVDEDIDVEEMQD